MVAACWLRVVLGVVPKSLGRFGSGEQTNSGLFDQSSNAIGLSAILLGGSQHTTGVGHRVLAVVKVVVCKD